MYIYICICVYKYTYVVHGGTRLRTCHLQPSGKHVLGQKRPRSICKRKLQKRPTQGGNTYIQIYIQKMYVYINIYIYMYICIHRWQMGGRGCVPATRSPPQNQCFVKRDLDLFSESHLQNRPTRRQMIYLEGNGRVPLHFLHLPLHTRALL